MIPINKPIFDNLELREVSKVIQSGKFTVSAYSTEGGENVQRFEKKLREFVGTRHAVAVNSGTAALECALLTLKIGYGDKVIVPSLTFVATANAVTSVGATAIFCDVDKHGQLSFDHVKKLCNEHKIAAIIIVDLYGRISEDIKFFKSLGVPIIEDSCQALGTKGAGTYGDIGCFSFYASKVCTTMGLGGAVVTDNPVIDSYLKVMRNQGMVNGNDCRFGGRNLLMGEANAAFGCVQLDRLPSFIESRRYNMKQLDLFEDTNGYMATILSPQRDEMLKMFHDADIGVATYYDKPIHYHKMYQGWNLPMTEKYASEVLNIPVHPEIYSQEIDMIKYIIAKFKYSSYSTI